MEPIVPIQTECVGMSQTDIIVRTGLIATLAFIRKRPWLLDYAFASMVQDTLTASAYGEDERKKAKQWFLKHDIPVIMTPRPFDGNQPMPCVAFSALDDSETSNTLADKHYVTREEVEANFTDLTAPFHPVRYTGLTGIMIVPDAIASALDLTDTTMAVVDKDGVAHTIIEVPAANEIHLLEGTVANFNPCTIRPAIPPLVAALESMVSRESYAVTCCVVGEPVYLTWLYSVVKFALLLGREEFFEARGFGESGISSRGVETGLYGETSPQHAFSRSIILQGNVRNAWPKLSERILSVSTVVAAHNAGNPIVDDDLAYDGSEDNLSGVVED